MHKGLQVFNIARGNTLDKGNLEVGALRPNTNSRRVLLFSCVIVFVDAL